MDQNNLQIQTSIIKSEPDNSGNDLMPSYPTPDISPSELGVLQNSYSSQRDAKIADWNISTYTPRPSATERTKNEESIAIDGNETESAWDGDSSFEVSANLISEIHQKYGDDYLNSAEYHSILAAQSNSHGLAHSSRAPQSLEPVYNRRELPWDNGETYDRDSPEEEESGPGLGTPTPAAKPAKRRATMPSLKRKAARTKKRNTTGGSVSAVRKWTESDDDKVAFLREYGNLKWHEVTEFINGRHTPQAVQMRYLRSLKRRNDTLTPNEKAKLYKLVVEDYENRFKRISTQMGPSFTQVRVQKIFLEDAGMSHMLKAEKVWTKEEIGEFVDEAAGDFDSFVVPYRADKLPPKATAHMEKYLSHSYKDLIRMYVGADGASGTR